MSHAGRWAAIAFLLLFSLPAAGHAQQQYRMDASAARTMRVLPASRFNLKRLYAKNAIDLSQVDSIVNFSGSYKAKGYSPTGKPQNTWLYTMAGLPPQENKTTMFRMPIIPVSVELLSPTGALGYDSGHPLISDATQFVPPVMDSPLFQNSTYSSSKRPTQFTDAVMRAEFRHGAKDGWHTLLDPVVVSRDLLKVPYGSYYYALNAKGTCCAFILIDSNAFASLFLPSGAADSSTVVGRAELSGMISSKDISTFLFPNTYLYVGSPQNCCILGFHTADYQPARVYSDSMPRDYVLLYASWISPGTLGSGPQDITALSHEIAETFNDPFVASDGIHNITPWWLSPNGNCEDILEDGDVIEGLPNATYPVTLNGYNYHPQNEALLQWFEFERYSDAIGHAYSYPDSSTLTELSPVEQANCK